MATSVSNLQISESAETDRNSIRDPANTNKLAVRSYSKTRTKIATETQQQAASIKQAVREETHNHIHTLIVRVTSHNIFLRGWCSSYYYKQLAQQAAMTCSGNKNLHNDIVVSY